MVAPNARDHSQVITRGAKSGRLQVGIISSIVVYPVLSEPMGKEQAWSGSLTTSIYGLAWVKRLSRSFASSIRTTPR